MEQKLSAPATTFSHRYVLPVLGFVAPIIERPRKSLRELAEVARHSLGETAGILGNLWTRAGRRQCRQ